MYCSKYWKIKPKKNTIYLYIFYWCLLWPTVLVRAAAEITGEPSCKSTDILSFIKATKENSDWDFFTSCKIEGAVSIDLSPDQYNLIDLCGLEQFQVGSQEGRPWFPCTVGELKRIVFGFYFDTVVWNGKCSHCHSCIVLPFLYPVFSVYSHRYLHTVYEYILLLHCCSFHCILYIIFYNLLAFKELYPMSWSSGWSLVWFSSKNKTK